MNRMILTMWTAIAFLATAPLADISAAQTWQKNVQQKHRISGKVGPADSKSTQEQLIEVGDVPGHQAGARYWT